MFGNKYAFTSTEAGISALSRALGHAAIDCFWQDNTAPFSHREFVSDIRGLSSVLSLKKVAEPTSKRRSMALSSRNAAQNQLLLSANFYQILNSFHRSIWVLIWSEWYKMTWKLCLQRELKRTKRNCSTERRMIPIVTLEWIESLMPFIFLTSILQGEPQRPVNHSCTNICKHLKVMGIMVTKIEKSLMTNSDDPV